MDLGKFIAREGKRKGLCVEWRQMLSGISNKSDLLQLYLRGIDFCLLKDFPSKEFLKKEGGDLLDKFGIFVDRKNLISTNREKVVCLGNSEGEVRCSGYSVTEVFIKHQSEVKIQAKDNSFTMVDVFESGKVVIEASDNSKVCVNHYGGEILHSSEDAAQVKIIEKHKKTY